jgi:hypothetical protein
MELRDYWLSEKKDITMSCLKAVKHISNHAVIECLWLRRLPPRTAFWHLSFNQLGVSFLESEAYTEEDFKGVIYLLVISVNALNIICSAYCVIKLITGSLIAKTSKKRDPYSAGDVTYKSLTEQLPSV